MIHIWLPNPQAPIRLWQDTSQTWQFAENWQEIATLIALQHPKDKSTCLYFPSMYALHTRPNLSQNQLKALGDNGRRYLFEDISIAGIDDLQVKSYQEQLYALHRSDCEQWTHSASLAGLNVVALLPDFLLLTDSLKTQNLDSQSAVYYQDTSTKLLYSQAGLGLAISDIGLSYQQLSQQESTKIDKLYLTGEITQSLNDTLKLLPNLSVEHLQNTPKPTINPNRHALNFAIIKQQSHFPPYLKVILSVAVLAIFVSFIVDGLRIYYYQQATKQTKAEIKQQYNQWFPNETFNERLNIQRLLSGRLINQNSANSDNKTILTQLNSIQPILQQYQITARQLNFQNNTLQLELLAQNNEALNQFITALNAQGIQAKLGTVSPSDKGAIASVDISL